MPRFTSSLAVLALIAGCSPAQPPEIPETPAATSEPATPSDPTPPPPPTATAMPGSVVKGGDVDKSSILESYELTPSDCDALGRQYGAVARSDQMAALSPKLSEKQRSATAAQVDRVVSKLEESWIQSCHTTLVNKSVEHARVKCALGSKTVKQFDVCLNGEGGTPQSVGKPGRKK